MSVTTGTFPGVRIVDMPDLGAVTDTSSMVGERAGSGRFAAAALRDYTTSGLTAYLTAYVPTIAALRTLASGAAAVYVQGYHAAGDGGGGFYNLGAAGTDNGGTIISSANGTYVLDTQGQPYSLKWFGARGTGSVDDGPVVQAWINALVAAKVGKGYVPSASVGYRIDTPINMTNLTGALTIEGDGIQAPVFGLAITPPVGGSLFLGNTGTGKPVFDCSGSNNILFRDCNIHCIGQPTPSRVGILSGTSTSAPSAQAPGGSNFALENVAIYMANADNSVPVACVAGAGLNHFFNVWTLGVYGIALSGSNLLAILSPYVTFGPNIGIDGVVGVGCNLLGYGGGQVLYLDGANNQTWDRLYVATIYGGGGYVGQPYAIYLNSVVDVRIQVESDYFPSVVETGLGDVQNVAISGSSFPNTTPIPSGVPAVAFFAGSFVEVGCAFDVRVVSGPLPNSNYYYTTPGGGSPVISGFNGCTFSYDLTVSPNVFFGNCASGAAVPFYNLRFNGNTDAGTSGPLAFEVNGVAATAAQIRAFINGIRYGTA